MRRRTRSKPKEGNSTLWVTVGAVVLALIILGAVFLNRPPSAATTASTTSGESRPIPNPEVPRINLADARAKVGQPNVIFVDTRSSQEYFDSHVQGAINIALPDIPARVNDLPKDAEIITYCT
mgnify:CR=1 FL=1